MRAKPARMTMRRQGVSSNARRSADAWTSFGAAMSDMIDFRIGKDGLLDLPLQLGETRGATTACLDRDVERRGEPPRMRSQGQDTGSDADRLVDAMRDEQSG